MGFKGFLAGVFTSAGIVMIYLSLFQHGYDIVKLAIGILLIG